MLVFKVHSFDSLIATELLGESKYTPLQVIPLERNTQNCLEVCGIYRGCRECIISIISPRLIYFLNSTASNIRGLHYSHLRPIALRLTCQTITSTKILKTLISAAWDVYFIVSVQYSRTLCT